MSEEEVRLEQRRIEEREYESARYEQEVEMQYIEHMQERIRELEAEVRRWAENSEKNGTAMTQARNDLAELQRKYDALVERVESAQSHTRETLRLLQWDQLGWDVPEEVIESLGKADSELRALLEEVKGDV